MNNNRFKSGALFGSLVGISLGMIYGSKMGMFKKRKLMRTAKRAKSTLINGMNSLWG
ncbi:hypothetical protein [Tepidimicrobium xylanilyticum]|uniref:YtxH-like protein n=1 Tax=Tepidimicrobium xylanilyticum TaxID=1123352 RepID=A0A1H2SJ94_9FIRM|nr:hypothetical protein [Tepidimicrobium xylanilyticum]GMG96198.1 hypothetical protein EN5CB1_10240 [Tepidimicrobium xylanilyticum]SDW31711.1 hypothetical protein SAMN05660923_00466 [Tepidimicrobium xylanilyticum]